MKFRQVCKIISNSINPKKHPNKIFELYSLPAFDDFRRPEKLCGNEIDSNKYVIPQKTILFNKLNVRFKRVWKIIDNVSDNKLCSTEFLPLVIDETIADFDYIYFLLISNQVTDYLCAPTTNTSGSHKRIDPDFLLDMEIDLPELNKQKTIAKKLKRIEDQIYKCFNFESISFDFLKKTFDYWFVSYNFPNAGGKSYSEDNGDFTIDKESGLKYPTSWGFEKLGKFFDIIRGVSYKPEDSSDCQIDNSIALLRSNNIYDDRLVHDDIIYVNEKRINKEQILHKNDIFICMSNGSKNLIGKNTIIAYDTQYSFGAFCAKIKNKEIDYLGFTNMFFKSDFYKAYISQICANTSINNIGNEMITDLKFPIPSIEVAKSFNEIYLHVMNQVGISHENMIKAKQLLKQEIDIFMNNIFNVRED